MTSFLSEIDDPIQATTALGESVTFPESMAAAYTRYASDIELFIALSGESTTTAQLLEKVRSPSLQKATRMSLLKLFRRCVSPVLDTETTKRITKVKTHSLVSNYGDTFKNITVLQDQLAALDTQGKSTLALLISEYDSRGRSGYELTTRFFDWFEAQYAPLMSITGPRGAGPDIELSTVFPDFEGSFPCDFVVRERSSERPLAVGFIRYDSTRGGAQSDDRTGGNANKVHLAKEFAQRTERSFRILFVSDGPGLAHGDTWREAKHLDGSWEGNVRVSTLKLAPLRITSDWLLS